MKIAIFAREIGNNWVEQFLFILNELREREVEFFYYTPFYNSFLEQIGENRSQLEGDNPLFFECSDTLQPDVDFFLSFGGDGTLLESLTLVQDKEIPVVGINFGRLGFLTSVDSAADSGWIDLLFEGRYNLERRQLLEVSSPILPNSFCRHALNEVTFQRRDPFMLSVHAKVNGMELPPYWSDGLVLSTPTGSTAYSLSVGGPIVVPSVPSITLAPISPHNLNVRPLVIRDDSVVEVYIESRAGEAILSVDNRSITLPEGVRVVVTKAKFELLYLSFSPKDFIGALRDKLMWGEDRRNLLQQ